MAKQPRCELESSLRGAQARVQKYRLGGWVSVRLEGRQVTGSEDTQAREKEAQLDGCYTLRGHRLRFFERLKVVSRQRV